MMVNYIHWGINSIMKAVEFCKKICLWGVSLNLQVVQIPMPMPGGEVGLDIDRCIIYISLHSLHLLCTLIVRYREILDAYT